MRNRKMLKRRPRRQARKGRRAVKRNPNSIGGPNTCQVVETVPTAQVNLNTPVLFVKAGITGTRAPVIAQQFGLYRIAKVIYTHRPLNDTFAAGLPGVGSFAVQVPTLYWKMNRYGDQPAGVNGDYMRALGAKPIRLDDKNVSFSYRPNILQVQNNAVGNNAASIKISPWLSTDDLPQDGNFTLSTAEHYGHTLFVEAAGAGAANGPVCNLDIKVIYEFKNPRLTRGISSVLPSEPGITLKV